MKNIIIFSFIAFALVFAGVPVYAATDVCPNIVGDQAEVPEGYYLKDGNCEKTSANGNPMDAPCFSELGFQSCAEKLTQGLISFVASGEEGNYGVCNEWFPAGCLEIVPNPVPVTAAIIHQNYGDTDYGYTCDYLVGCELDLSLI